MSAPMPQFVANIMVWANQTRAGMSGAARWGWKQIIFGVRCILIFHSRAWRAMGDPIVGILKESDPGERDALTRRWREQMNSQLNVILVTVGFSARHRRRMQYTFDLSMH